MSEKDGTSQFMAHPADKAAQAPAAGESRSAGPVRTVDPAAADGPPVGGGGVNGSPGEALQEPPSPCVSVCALDENDLCMGCYRTADEITDWFMANAAQKRKILARAAQRREEDNPIKLL